MIRTPLAWYSLTHDPIRFGLFVMGITFAVILMFVQYGFRNALLDSNTQFHDQLNCDLVLVSASRQAIAMPESFSRRRLEQARNASGVQEVHPLYFDNSLSVLKNTAEKPDERNTSRNVRVIGVNPSAHLLKQPEFRPDSPQMLALARPGTALFDRKSKKNPERAGETLFGPLANGVKTELNDKPIEFAGSMAIGSDFTSDGSIVVNEETFLNAIRRPYLYPGSSAEARVDLGLVRVKPGTDVQTAKRNLIAVLLTGEAEADVAVYTVDEFRDYEKQFWLNNTPIGFAFGFGTFMGFAVGLVICYQILSGDVSDHLPEYATLKAIGYGNLYLAWIVLQEALILAAVGFTLGFGVSWVAYTLLTEATDLPLVMTLGRAGLMLGATVLMCCLSAMIALVGLFRVDPADVF